MKYKYDNKVEMQSGLADFLIFYNLYRSHESLKNELRVKTPFEAVLKWVELKPEYL